VGVGKLLINISLFLSDIKENPHLNQLLFTVELMSIVKTTNNPNNINLVNE
jgi:hypothetical protein